MTLTVGDFFDDVNGFYCTQVMEAIKKNLR